MLPPCTLLQFPVSLKIQVQGNTKDPTHPTDLAPAPGSSSSHSPHRELGSSHVDLLSVSGRFQAGPTSEPSYVLFPLIQTLVPQSPHDGFLLSSPPQGKHPP